MALIASQAAKNAAAEILKEIRLPVHPYCTDELAMGTWSENFYRRALTRARWAELITKMDASPLEISAVTPSDVLAAALEAINMAKTDFARWTGLNLSNISMVLSDRHWLRGIREKMTSELWDRLPEQTNPKEIRLDRHAFFRECAEDIMSDEWEMGSSWKIRRELDKHLRAISSDPELSSDALVLSSVMRDGFTRDKAVCGWYDDDRVVRVEKINDAPCVLVHVNNIERARAFFSRKGALSNHYYGEIGSRSEMDSLLDVPIFLWMEGLVHGIHPQANRLLSYPFDAVKEGVLNVFRKKKFPDGIVAAIKEQKENPAAYQEETFTPSAEYKPCNSDIKEGDEDKPDTAPVEPEPVKKTPQEVAEQKRRIASRVKTLASRHFNGVIDTAWRSIYDAFFEECGIDPLYEGKKAKKSGVAYLADNNQLDDFEKVIGDVEEAFYKNNR